MWCARCNEIQDVIRNGHSTSGAQLYRCKLILKTFQLSFQNNVAKNQKKWQVMMSGHWLPTMGTHMIGKIMDPKDALSILQQMAGIRGPGRSVE